MINFFRMAWQSVRKNYAKVLRIHFVPPNYLFRGDWNRESIIVDSGCGFDADFSVYMMDKYGLKSIGIDPTKKHVNSLNALSMKTGGRFRHVPIAISETDGSISFNESEDNVSGSIFKEHRNVRRDKIKTYEVESVSLAKLPDRLGLSGIEYIKLDLEGAEYAIVKKLSVGDLVKYRQIFIEFHHHCVPIFSKADTKIAVGRLESMGFKSYTIDGNNYLFYRK